MQTNPNKFTLRQRWLMRLYLTWASLVLLSIGIMTVFTDQIEETPNWLDSITVIMMFAPIVLLIWAIVEIFIFLFIHRGNTDRPRIWRSLVILFTSPLATVLYVFFLVIVLASFASCTYVG